MIIKVFFLINANIHLISCVPAFRDVQNTIDKFWRRLSIPNNQRPREKESIRSRALTQALHLIWGNIIQFLKPSSLCIPAGPGDLITFEAASPPSPQKDKDCMIAIWPPNLHKDLNPPISVGWKRQYTLFKSILKTVITYSNMLKLRVT